MLEKVLLFLFLNSLLLTEAITFERSETFDSSSVGAVSDDAVVSTKNLSAIWDYASGDTKVQGISLGGWFVLEPYITPSLFEQFGTNSSEIPVDEYTFTKTLGKEEAEKQLRTHWASYYTESDFEDIKNYGFNTVRIPIGYWAFYLLDDDPYVQGQEEYLDLSLSWAQSRGLKVWIDLHGVPGSQNGFDNSGKRGSVDWQDEEENILLSYETLNYIFGKYGGKNYTDTVTGIEIVNEPLSGKLNSTDLLDFYYNSYYDFRILQKSKGYFVIQDAFEPIGFWNKHFNNQYQNVSAPYTEILDSELSTDYFEGVVVDHHHYEVFTYDQLAKSSDARIQDIRNYASSIKEEQHYHPSLVGEFSGAITDCAKWLNGVGTGARYDGTFNSSQLIRNSPEDKSLGLLSENATSATLFGNLTSYLRGTSSDGDSTRNCSNLIDYDDFTDQHKEDIRKFIEIQLIEYEKNTAGWIFWNYKTENAIEWDFKKLAKHGLFPQPFNDYKYFYENGTAIEEEDDDHNKVSGSPASVHSTYATPMHILLSVLMSMVVGSSLF